MLLKWGKKWEKDKMLVTSIFSTLFSEAFPFSVIKPGIVSYRNELLACNTRKGTFGRLRKMSFQISLLSLLEELYFNQMMTHFFIDSYEHK